MIYGAEKAGKYPFSCRITPTHWLSTYLSEKANPWSLLRQASVRPSTCGRGFPAMPNGLFRTPEEPVSDIGTAFPVTRKGSTGMPTTVKQWNHGVITARPYIPNGGATDRLSQRNICKTAHFIGISHLVGKAERHPGTLKTDATNVKSVKREQHCHSRKQCRIGTYQPPFSDINTVVSACRD